jgi:hypothetical protein
MTAMSSYSPCTSRLLNCFQPCDIFYRILQRAHPRSGLGVGGAAAVLGICGPGDGDAGVVADEALEGSFGGEQREGVVFRALSDHFVGVSVCGLHVW